MEDWPALEVAFRSQYREGHPLRERDFFAWRFGYPQHGRAVIAIGEHGEVLGHVGAALDHGLSWIINVFLAPEARGRGLLGRMYGEAREYGALAATNVNRAGTDMYRNMGWHRHADLQRFVAWRRDVPTDRLVSPCDPDITRWASPPDDHYWRQPGLVGATAPDGSTVVDQREVGGLRAITVVDPVALVAAAFDAGFAWIDYVTSWNDPLLRSIEDEGWSSDVSAPIPWLLAPVDRTSRCSVNVFSELPLDPRRVIRRSESDHGRVGSYTSAAR